jgi:hypothetical protein
MSRNSPTASAWPGSWAQGKGDERECFYVFNNQKGSIDEHGTQDEGPRMSQDGKTADIKIPLSSSAIARLKHGQSIRFTFDLTIEPDHQNGQLHLRAHLSPPRVKRVKGRAKHAANGAG